MMKSDPILEQDILIGQYTLGLLSPQENQRLQALLGDDATAARTALQWEETFLHLVDALPRAQPPRALLEQILTTLDLPLPAEDHPEVSSLDVPRAMRTASPDRRESTNTPPPEPTIAASDSASPPEPTVAALDIAPVQTQPQQVLAESVTHQPQQVRTKPVSQQPAPASKPQVRQTPPSPASTPRRPLSRKVLLGSTAAIAVIAALLALAMYPRQPAEPPIVIVEMAPSKGAILQAPGQSSTPGWVVTIDSENNVTLSPQVSTDTPAENSVQLWTYNRAAPQPRSLGLIDPNQSVAVPAELMGEIGDNQFFEMTLEPAGGSPTAEPTGPILFIGRVVTFS